MTTMPCTVCEAPVPVWEFGRHVLMCLRIKQGHTPDLALVAMQDQMEAASRERNANRAPGVATPQSPVPGWQGVKPTKPTMPPGAVECHWCNELTCRECVHCDGKGYI